LRFFLFIKTKNNSETITKEKNDTLKRLPEKCDALKRLQNQRVTLKRLHRKKVTPLNDLNFGEFLVSDKNAPVFELYIKS